MVGHRAAKCLLIKCFKCNKAGDYASKCPNKQANSDNLSCQVCETQGTINVPLSDDESELRLECKVYSFPNEEDSLCDKEETMS